MVFSDTSTKQGIVEETDFFANSDSSTYPITSKTRNINRWLDRVCYLIQSADQAWQFDDSNNSDLPIATTDLVSGQGDYTFDTTFLKILKVMVADQSGNFYEIFPTDVFNHNFTQESQNMVDGYVYKYDKTGNSLFLFNTPNYSYTGGIKIYYQRNMNYFTTTDTTATPGFNPQFHRILSLGAALDLCLAKDLPQAKNLAVKVQEMEQGMLEFYSNRGKDEPPMLRSRRASSI